MAGRALEGRHAAPLILEEQACNPVALSLRMTPPNQRLDVVLEQERRARERLTDVHAGKQEITDHEIGIFLFARDGPPKLGRPIFLDGIGQRRSNILRQFGEKPEREL